MADESEVSVSQLFAEVIKQFRNGDFIGAQKSSNKILKIVPNDVDALKCRIVCLIQQSCFQEALDSINSCEKKKLLKLNFEKAYCLYRLNRLFEAQEILLKIDDAGLKEKELLAQVQYRLEDYASCLDLYKYLIKNSADDYEDEREANMAAVVAAAKMWKDENIGETQLRRDTYELSYNYACLLIAQEELHKALSVLEASEVLCRKSLEADEDITDEEIEEESAVIKAQIGYIKQMQGKANEALSSYNQILKGKPNDIALVAVVSNNIVAANKDKDLFDSKKRVKALSVDGLQHKLTKMQQLKLEKNKCLLNMYTNQIANCKKGIENLKTTFKDADKHTTALLEAAIFLRDKHSEQALSHLESLLKSGVHTTDVTLTLAQLYLSKGKIDEAVEILENLSEIKHAPAVVSLVVSLCNILGKKEKAIKCLDSAIQYGQQNPSKLWKDQIVNYMRESSKIKLENGDIKGGVEMLETLRREDPSDIVTLAKIISAYAQVNTDKAHEYPFHYIFHSF